MKTLIFTILFLAASPQCFAAQKCVVDGKTQYKQGPCPQGGRQLISGGTFSNLSLASAGNYQPKAKH